MKKLYCFLILLSTANLLFANQEPIILQEGFKIIHLGSGYDNYLKSDKALNNKQLESIIRNNEFNQKVKFKTVRDKNYHLINFLIKNVSADTQKIIVRVEDPKIDSIQLLVYDGISIQDFGTSSNFLASQRKIGKNLRREYSLIFEPNKQYSLFFYFNNRTSFIRLRVPINIIEADYYPTYIFKIGLFDKFYLGTLLFIILFTFSLFVIFYEAVYLNYLIYLVGLAVFYFSMENYLVYFSSAESVLKFSRIVISTAYILMIWGYMGFSEKFLNVKEFLSNRLMSVWQFIKYWAVAIYLLNACELYLGLDIMWTINITVFILIPSILIFIWAFVFYNIKHKNKSVYLFLIGYIAVFLNSTVIDIFTELGFFGDNLFVFVCIIHLFELFTLTIGLIYRFKTIQTEKRKLKTIIVEQKQKIFQTELHAQETERQRIAQDLHDEVGNSLAALKNYISQTNLELGEKINKIAQDVRNISHNLASIDFEKTTLSVAFQNLINRHNEAENIDYELIEVGKLQKLPAERELVIYRIVCELLNNIQKHSKAQKATLQLVYEGQNLTIIVEDDGIGIKTKSTIEEGIGLKHIQTRVAYLNAKLTIDDDGKGTIVVIDVPI
jgi:signal transduction histidine kinase